MLHRSSRDPGERDLPSKILSAIAVLVCLLFVAVLTDTSLVQIRLMPSAPPLPLSDSSERTAAIRLKVVDQGDGSPVSGARIEVYSFIDGDPHLAAVAETDGAGEVAIGGLPPGEAWVIASSDKHARGSTRLSLESGVRQVLLELGKASDFEVVVVDQLQRPIKNVQVTMYGADPLPFRALTDHRGLAKLTGLGLQPYSVDIEAKGFDPKFLPRVWLRESPLFVKLERLGALEVTVVDADGGPAKEANVMIAGSSMWPSRSAKTDDRGKVLISGLTRGFYDLKATLGDQVSDTIIGVMLDHGETKQVELTLIRGLYVKVIVTDGEGEDRPGVVGADVALVEGGLSSFPLYGRTDGDGVVVLGPVGMMESTVSARAEGYVVHSGVAVAEGQTEVRVALIRGGVIIGEVVDERDYPIEGVQLEVVGVGLDGMPISESSRISSFRDDHFAFSLTGAAPLIPAGDLGVMPVIPDIPGALDPQIINRSAPKGDPWVSGSDGTFELRPVTPGRIRVVARHPSYVEGISDAVELKSGGEAKVKLVLYQGGILEGRVVEEDGFPAAGARVEVTAVDSGQQRVTYAAEDGSFVFVALPKEILIAVARADSPERIVTQISLTIPDRDRTRVEIILPTRRQEVDFRVTDEIGYPLSRVEIRATSLTPGEPLSKTMFTTDDGEANLPDARGLPLRVVCLRPSKAPMVTQIESAPQLIELTMAEALEAEGEIRGERGAIENGQIMLFTPTGTRNARSDTSGEFKFFNLAPGTMRLLVIADGYIPDERFAEIKGDNRHPVNLGTIELKRGGSVSGEVVDSSDEPIVGARVASGRVPTYLPLGPLPFGVVTTDGKGRFVLRDLPPGEITIEAYKVDLGRSYIDGVNVRVGERTRDIRIVISEGEESSSSLPRGGSLAVTLSERLSGKERQILFEHVPIGGEAQNAGIEPGDRLLLINGYPVRSLEEARQRLTGPLSEDLVLDLARDPDLRWTVRVPRERLRR